MNAPATPVRVVDRIEEVCQNFQITSLSGQIDSVRAMMAREGIVDVAVLGRFKAGKSSFLNSLASQPILPVGVIPVTSVITRMRYGASPRATVIHQDGEKRVIELSSLDEFISERRNPKNQKHVAAVEIELPSLAAFPGLEFVDTPGLGSVFKHNTSVSLDWLPRVGAALIAIGVDPPLSDQDLELIGQCLRFTPKIVILLTKADLLAEGQLQEVHEFVSSQLRACFQVEFPIYLYSAAETQGALRDRFTREILAPLSGARDQESQRILRYKIDRLISECSDFLKIAAEASRRSHAERERLREQILGEKLHLGGTRDDLQMMTRDWLGRTRPSYMRKLSELQMPLTARLQQDLTARFPGWNLSLYRFTRAYEDWMREEFTRTIGGISSDERDLFYAPLANARSGFIRAVDSFQSRLTENIEEFLGVKTERLRFEVEIRKPTAPDISISRAFDSHLDLLSFLIPMAVFGPAIRKHFLNQLPYEVEKNLSRLASQWTERINGAIQEMARQAERFLSDQVLTMENLLLRASDPAESILEIRSEILSHKSDSMPNPA